MIEFSNVIIFILNNVQHMLHTIKGSWGHLWCEYGLDPKFPGFRLGASTASSNEQLFSHGVNWWIHMWLRSFDIGKYNQMTPLKTKVESSIQALDALCHCRPFHIWKSSELLLVWSIGRALVSCSRPSWFIWRTWAVDRIFIARTQLTNSLHAITAQFKARIRNSNKCLIHRILNENYHKIFLYVYKTKLCMLAYEQSILGH